MALLAVLAVAATSADASHPAVASCGGAELNRNDGLRFGPVVSKKTENLMERFLQRADALPGASIAIVKGNRVVFLRGFGFRDLERCARARSDTRYYLKSTTKHFLGVAAAALHEKGAIELDAPIREYLPELSITSDGSLGSIRDSLTHTQPYYSSGLNYRTAFPGNLPEDEFVHYLNEHNREKDTRFRYSNVGPIMAAHAIGAKIGSNWREFIPAETFAPVGMTDSFTVMAQAEDGPMAQGYIGAERDDFQPNATKVDAQMTAAGGSVSTAADMARWLIVNLNGGVIDGKQAIPKRAIEQSHARQAQQDRQLLEHDRFAYGLGMNIADYDGDLLMNHFGGETHMSFMPEHGLGVVVLTNELSFGVRVTHALANTIYDLLLDKPDIDARMERRLSEIAKGKQAVAMRFDNAVAELRQSAPRGKSNYALDELVGDYVNARLGTIAIEIENGSLRNRYGVLEGPLAHVSGDAYIEAFTVWGLPPALFVFRNDPDLGFVLDWGGRIFVRRN